MSMQSVNNFDPSSSTPAVDSSATQAKVQQQLNNDHDETEKVVTSSESVVNGQNDKINNKTGENTDTYVIESISQNIGAGDSADTCVNGQSEKHIIDISPAINSTITDNQNEVKKSASASEVPGIIEKSDQNDSVPIASNESSGDTAPTAPTPIVAPSSIEIEPALPALGDVAKEDVSSIPVSNVDHVSTTATAAPSPPPPVETIATSYDNVPESDATTDATTPTDSEKPERKGGSPRGKTKSSTGSTPPTRQSKRVRKPISSTNEDEKQGSEDPHSSTVSRDETSPERARHQAVAIAEDIIQASNQSTSTSDDHLTEEDGDAGDSNTRKKASSPSKTARVSANVGKKREASLSPSAGASKKTKASLKRKKSFTSNNEQKMDVDVTTKNETEVTATDTTTNENETVRTPPKKVRTSRTTKTPESNEEYTRKLRPRK